MIRILIALAIAVLTQIYPIVLAFNALWTVHGLSAAIAVFCVPALGTAIIIEVLK